MIRQQNRKRIFTSHIRSAILKKKQPVPKGAGCFSYNISYNISCVSQRKSKINVIKQKVAARPCLGRCRMARIRNSECRFAKVRVSPADGRPLTRLPASGGEAQTQRAYLSRSESASDTILRLRRGPKQNWHALQRMRAIPAPTRSIGIVIGADLYCISYQ